MRIGLFTNNYVPFCGGVTISVETLRQGLEARGHEVWTFAPRFPGPRHDPPRVVRFPSVPAAWPTRCAGVVRRSSRLRGG